MFLSKQLLTKYNKVFKTYDDEKMVSMLNAVGIEVETITKNIAPTGLVLAKIISVEKVNGSNHLNLCKVLLADNTELQIVCGADNVAVDKFVVVAPVGTKINNEFTIGRRQLLGVESNGMICAYSEISPQLAHFIPDSEAKSIIILDDVDFKTDLYDYLGLNDTIYEISVPSNRNDLNSVLGVCNELNYQILYGFRLCTKKIRDRIKNINNLNLVIDNKTTNILKNYIIGEFKNKLISKPTPWEIRSILINSGYKINNNLFDYANYIQLTTACVVNLYNSDSIQKSLKYELTEQSIRIKSNSEEILLPANTLIAKSNGEIVSIVGIKTFDKFKVKLNSESVIFEILNLDYNYVRNLSEQLQIKNSAISLMSKPLPNIYLNYAYQILKDFFFVKHQFNLVALKNNYTNKKIKIDLYDLLSILGLKISKDKATNAIVRAGIEQWAGKFKIPAYRNDIDNIYDLAEEAMKHLNINESPANPALISAIPFNNEKNGWVNKLNDLRHTLINLGLYETKTMNLVSKEYAEMFNFDNLSSYEVSNPISNLRRFYRNSLVPSLLEVLKNNLNNNQPLFNCFEIQNIHTFNKNYNCLTILISKPIINTKLDNILNPSELSLNFIFNKLKDYFNANIMTYNHSADELSHFAKKLILNNETIGYMGKISKSTLNKFDINIDSIYVLTINLETFNTKQNQIKTFTKPLTLNPIYKELTVINANDNNINQYLNSIKKIKNITNAALINLYIDANKQKSYTIQITINSNQQLNNVEIENILNSCINELSNHQLTLKH